MIPSTQIPRNDTPPLPLLDRKKQPDEPESRWDGDPIEGQSGGESGTDTDPETGGSTGGTP